MLTITTRKNDTREKKISIRSKIERAIRKEEKEKSFDFYLVSKTTALLITKEIVLR